MTLGQRISQYRKQLGISQEMLGERLGVSRQAVSKWETDAASPDMENLLALAREFGVSVAELTATPEPQAQAAPDKKTKHNRLLWILLLPIVLFCSLVGIYQWNFYGEVHSDPPTPEAEQIISPPEADAPAPQFPDETLPSPAPETDFALLWYGANGDEEFLELGVQDDFFPFGTTLELTEPAEIQDTDFDIMTTHRADCGSITIGYYHIEEDLDLDPESPERESIWYLSTIVSSVRTPRGVHPDSTKAQVLDAYGDELVYCMKEEGSYSLVKHDYYYAFQTPETFGSSLQFFMLDGIVVGIRVEHMAEQGNTAFAPDNISRFPLKDGEPDFSLRQEPEQEELSDARKVYIAWNQLVTNDNLSAEEQYAYRRDVFGLLPTMDWQEFGLCGGYNMRDDTIFALMAWLDSQDSYSSSEILWIQMGCTAQGIDGAYAERYASILSSAFFYDPILFTKTLVTDIPESTKSQAISLTAYDADWYPTELMQSTEILEEYLSNFTLAEEEAGWGNLLLLYLSTPIEERYALPDSPNDLK